MSTAADPVFVVRYVTRYVRKACADIAAAPCRWAEWWASPDDAEAVALLDGFERWDGDDSALPAEVVERYVALDRRLMAYEDWCESEGLRPARRPRPGPSHWWGE